MVQGVHAGSDEDIAQFYQNLHPDTAAWLVPTIQKFPSRFGVKPAKKGSWIQSPGGEWKTI
jgi:hypothetical protein